ncbi:MAG: transcriptional repressor [Arcobacter sp.]|nr:MAG: transcriptional repressor [Arcobacter sp.]
MKKDLTISYDDFMVKFKETMKSLGLNNSIQREYVLKILFNSETHLSADALLKEVKKEYSVTMGIATVYRILNLLEELHIVKGILINGNESKVYELDLVSHHDHMVCTKCNKIVEFYDEELERLQENVARENGFTLQSHNMLLYGICKECQ